MNHVEVTQPIPSGSGSTDRDGGGTFIFKIIVDYGVTVSIEFCRWEISSTLTALKRNFAINESILKSQAFLQSNVVFFVSFVAF